MSIARTPTLPLVVALLLLGGCPRNPATGSRQLSLVSEEQEIELGQQAAAQVEQQVGLYSDPAVQKYVSAVGKELAARSERPKLPWSFRVLDDPSPNAFALPGGQIFITRGLMTYLVSEAELAAVLGHEIGHVTAKHSVDMISRTQLAELAFGVGTVLEPGLAKFGGLAGGGLQLLFLKFSRDDENQADVLGLRYLGRSGYAAQGMPNLLATLGRQSALEPKGRLPTWLSTHPSEADRVERTQELIRKEGVDPAAGKVEREGYLARIDGMAFGEDPRNGYFTGQTFVQPQLRISVEVPQGWKAQNLAATMAALSPDQDAAFELQVAGQVTLEQAAQQFAASGVQTSQARGATVNGLPALVMEFTASTDSGELQGSATFIRQAERTFALFTYAGAERLARYADVFSQTVASFRPVSDPALLEVQPARVKIARVAQPTTLEQFNAARPSSVDLQRLAVLNQVEPQTQLVPGAAIKRVVGGTAARGG
ncbi:MAG: M48 family metalloprotease [Deltaproteobacteria bacterium]|nr:M48 family metalloprotease [Deltaproteobacteria bacterium]